MGFLPNALEDFKMYLKLKLVVPSVVVTVGDQREGDQVINALEKQNFAFPMLNQLAFLK